MLSGNCQVGPYLEWWMPSLPVYYDTNIAQKRINMRRPLEFGFSKGFKSRPQIFNSESQEEAATKK